MTPVSRFVGINQHSTQKDRHCQRRRADSSPNQTSPAVTWPELTSQRVIGRLLLAIDCSVVR